MTHIQNIMVPVDFSDASKKAVNYGLSLALKFESRLILAHIASYDTAAHDKAKMDLLELIPRDCREALTFEFIVKSGHVRSELIGIVEDKQIDLVVMGTRGRSYFERMMLESVTECMVRKLHVPVLTISHHDSYIRGGHRPPLQAIHGPGAVPLQRILYATDLTDGSEEGLDLVIRFARASDARVTVAHVIQSIDAEFHGMETGAFLPGYAAEVRARAEERLDRTVALASDGSVPISTVLAEGAPCETINRLAVEYKADLVVINLQDKGRLERAMLGRTAERLIRTATVPVLSLPLPAIYASRCAAA